MITHDKNPLIWSFSVEDSVIKCTKIHELIKLISQLMDIILIIEISWFGDIKQLLLLKPLSTLVILGSLRWLYKRTCIPFDWYRCLIPQIVHHVWMLYINFQHQNTSIWIMRVPHIHNRNLNNFCYFISNRYRTLYTHIGATSLFPMFQLVFKQEIWFVKQCQTGYLRSFDTCTKTFTCFQRLLLQTERGGLFPVSITNEYLLLLSAHLKLQKSCYVTGFDLISPHH